MPTTVIPLRHKDLAFLVHIFHQVPFPLQLLSDYIESLINQHLAPNSSPSAGSHEPELRTLTHREREILLLLACGKTAKPIAAELSLSLSTVRTHIQSILQKLRVHSCLEAVVLVLSARKASLKPECLV